MATVNVEQQKKDAVSPTKGTYYFQYVWILDVKTNRPVGLAPVQYTFS